MKQTPDIQKVFAKEIIQSLGEKGVKLLKAGQHDEAKKVYEQAKALLKQMKKKK